MAETEPTPWELMRILRSVDRKLDQVVTKDMFESESKRVDEKFGEVNKDIADERVARERAMASEKLQREQELNFERQARKDALKVESDERKKAWEDQEKRQVKLASNLKWLSAAILLPITLFIIERFGG